MNLSPVHRTVLAAALVVCASSAVSILLGCSFTEAALLHTIVGGVVLATFFLRRVAHCRPMIPAEYHWVIKTVAVLLPAERAVAWAEELQSQLMESKKPRRIAIDVVASVPALVSTAWLADLAERRHSRRAAATLLLVARLRLLLTPRSEAPSPISSVAYKRVQLQRSIGVDRTIAKVPCRAVPSLRLAQRVLRGGSPELRDAIQTIDALLRVRGQAHRVARRLRRDRSAWMRNSFEPYASLRAEQHRLRCEAETHALTLRAQLNLFVHSRQSPSRRMPRRRRRGGSDQAPSS